MKNLPVIAIALSGVLLPSCGITFGDGATSSEASGSYSTGVDRREYYESKGLSKNMAKRRSLEDSYMESNASRFNPPVAGMDNDWYGR